MFWHTWPRGLEVEPESCSSWRLMSPVAAFEHSDSHSLSEVFLCSPELLCWVVLQGNNFSETSPYLLSPGTDRVNQAAGAFSGEVLWAGVSLLNGKKVHCACTAERKRALWKSAPQAQPLTHPIPEALAQPKGLSFPINSRLFLAIPFAFPLYFSFNFFVCFPHFL